MRGVGLVVALLSSLIVSGCVGGDGAETPTETDAPDDAVVLTDDETGETRLVRPRIAAYAAHDPYQLHVMEDGTFEAGQHWNNNGDLLSSAGHDTGSAHVRDITDKVPVGIPVRITIEVNAELTEGDIDVWLDLPNEEVWAVSADAPIGGWSWFEFRILRTSTEPVELVVFYDELEPVQSFDYVVTYDIVALPHALLPGIPASVPIPAGTSSIEARFNGTDSGHLLVFDPQDRLVARLAATDGSANHTLPPRAPTGDYVVMLDGQSTGPAHLFVYAPFEPGQRESVPLGLLTQEIESTDGVDFAANEDAEVSFDLTRAPIQVGLQIDVDTVADGFRGVLTGPEGELASGSAEFTPPLLDPFPEGSFGFGLLTPMGADGLVPGTYTGTFSADTHGPGEAYGWIVHYGR